LRTVLVTWYIEYNFVFFEKNSTVNKVRKQNNQKLTCARTEQQLVFLLQVDKANNSKT